MQKLRKNQKNAQVHPCLEYTLPGKVFSATIDTNLNQNVISYNLT